MNYQVITMVLLQQYVDISSQSFATSSGEIFNFIWHVQLLCLKCMCTIWTRWCSLIWNWLHYMIQVLLELQRIDVFKNLKLYMHHAQGLAKDTLLVKMLCRRLCWSIGVLKRNTFLQLLHSSGSKCHTAATHNELVSRVAREVYNFKLQTVTYSTFHSIQNVDLSSLRHWDRCWELRYCQKSVKLLNAYEISKHLSILDPKNHLKWRWVGI